MSDVNYKKISMDGLWNNNPATVQILGLCPLLAVTGTVVNALGLGLATLVVLMGSNICVSLIRQYVTDAVRLPAFVMIIAAMVTVIEMLMQAFTFELYEILGIFIPLIVTNCTVLGRADAFASKNPVLPAALDGFMMGLGFLVILLILGGMRELIGQGTLFTNMQLLFGPMAADWRRDNSRRELREASIETGLWRRERLSYSTNPATSKANATNPCGRNT